MARLRAETQGRFVFSARTLEGACGISALERERWCRQAEDREEWQRTMARRWLVQVEQATERANLANWVQHNLGLDGPALRRSVGKVVTVAEDVRAASSSPGQGGALMGGSPDELSPACLWRRVPQRREREDASLGVDAVSASARSVDGELACLWRRVPQRREREDASPGVDAVSPAVGKWGDGAAHPVAEPLSRGVKGHAAREDEGDEAHAQVQLAGKKRKKGGRGGGGAAWSRASRAWRSSRGGAATRRRSRRRPQRLLLRGPDDVCRASCRWRSAPQSGRCSEWWRATRCWRR